VTALDAVYENYGKLGAFHGACFFTMGHHATIETTATMHVVDTTATQFPMQDRCPRCNKSWQDLQQAVRYCNEQGCVGGEGYEHDLEP
jgi:ssDNA-binding Zn-finger/Zn-ribbon topoisomerase 1